MDLIRTVWSGGDITAAALRDASPFREFSLLDEERQLCIFADLYNVVHSEKDLARALTSLEKLSQRVKLARYSFRRKQVADDLFAAVRNGAALNETVREALGVLSDYHEKVLRAAITEGRFSRRQAIFCSYNGAALNRALGPRRVMVPLRFQTRDDVTRRGHRDESPGPGSRVRFEHVHDVRHGDACFRMRVTNAIEHWRAATLESKEPETVRWVTATLRDDSVFYDIGANVGIYTLLALATRAGARAVCFEPEALNFARLLDNLDLNAFGTRAVAFAVGLSDENVIARFHSAGFMAGQAENWFDGLSGLDAQQKGRVVTGCPLYRLDAFLAAQPDLPAPTHLKIDVDGPEVRILKGAAATLADSRLRHVLVELFDDQVEEVKTLLAPYGFTRSGGMRHVTAPGRGHVGNHIFVRQ
jgi:FkbM family methyltransferase